MSLSPDKLTVVKEKKVIHYSTKVGGLALLPLPTKKWA